MVQRSCGHDCDAEVGCDAGKRASAVRTKNGAKAFSTWHLEILDEIFARQPFSGIRFENDIARMAGPGRLAAAPAMTMIESLRVARDFVADGSAQAASGE